MILNGSSKRLVRKSDLQTDRVIRNVGHHLAIDIARIMHPYDGFANGVSKKRAADNVAEPVFVIGNPLSTDSAGEHVQGPGHPGVLPDFTDTGSEGEGHSRFP